MGDVRAALEVALRAQSTAGVPTPKRVVVLLAALDAALAADPTGSAGGTTEVPPAAPLRWSAPIDPVDVATAAQLLGVSTRRVRALAERLGGRKTGTTWQFERADVLAERDRREDTA